MNNKIHPTAIIDIKAKIGMNNYIGPFCIIGPDVIMGDNNRLEAFVTLGTPAQHREYFNSEPGHVLIGSRNIFREYVTINGGTIGNTIVGNSCNFLIGSHVGHDTLVQDKCNLGNNTVLGGHSIVCEGANLGLSVVVHQFSIIGAYSMVGMNSTVTRDVIPFIITFGTPNESKRLNRIGLTRSGIKKEELHIFENWYEEYNTKKFKLPDLNHSYNNYIEAFNIFKNKQLPKFKI